MLKRSLIKDFAEYTKQLLDNKHILGANYIQAIFVANNNKQINGTKYTL